MTRDKDELAERAEVLADSVTVLNASTQDLSTRVRRTERYLLWTILSIGLDIVLTMLGGVLFIMLLVTQRGVQHNQERIENLQRQLGVVQQRTTDEVLCPLYEVFLSAYNPNSRPEGPARDQYEKSFDVVRKGYAALGCVSR